VRRALGILVLALLAVHAVELDSLQELLYACHVATILIGVGLLAGSRALVGAGFLFHLAVGFPSWLLDALARSTTISSVAVHVAPLAAGAWGVKRLGLPRRAPLLSFAMFAACCVVSFVATDPALNVNVVHAPWPPLARLGREGTWLVNGALAFTLPYLAERLCPTPWRKTLGRSVPADHRAV
jgi:hypothetical protein